MFLAKESVLGNNSNARRRFARKMETSRRVTGVAKEGCAVMNAGGVLGGNNGVVVGMLVGDSLKSMTPVAGKSVRLFRREFDFYFFKPAQNIIT